MKTILYLSHYKLNSFVIFAIEMTNLKSLLIIILLLFVIAGCGKDEESWIYCIDCELSTWVGDYDGLGEYYSEITGESETDVQTQISIENSSGNTLKTKFTAVDKFIATFISTKNDSAYYYDIPGSNKSLSLTLKEKGVDYKLSGTVKLYHNSGDSIILDHSISFDTYKLKH